MEVIRKLVATPFYNRGISRAPLVSLIIIGQNLNTVQFLPFLFGSSCKPSGCAMSLQNQGFDANFALLTHLSQSSCPKSYEESII